MRNEPFFRMKHIFGLGLLLLLILQMQTHTEEDTARHQNVEREVSETPEKNREDMALQHFQQRDFYRTIIENNLFRPLGWTPPDPHPTYRLIGTILPTDENTPPQAIIQSTAGNPKTYIVTIGEKIDAHTKVLSIAHKSVVLETDGKHHTLRLHIRF